VSEVSQQMVIYVIFLAKISPFYFILYYNQRSNFSKSSPSDINMVQDKRGVSAPDISVRSIQAGSHDLSQGSGVVESNSGLGTGLSADAVFLGQFVRSIQHLYKKSYKDSDTKDDMPLPAPDLNKLVETEANFFFNQYVTQNKSNVSETVQISGSNIVASRMFQDGQLSVNSLSKKGQPPPSAAIPHEPLKKSAVPARRPSMAPQAMVPEKGWRLWLRKHVYQDIYPESCRTAQDILQVYLERRAPPTYKAGFLAMFGMAVCNVISGEFSGWNVSIPVIGYGNFFIGNFLAALLYFTLADCLSELTSSIPVLGGSFAYSRAILGNFAGFVVGNSENLMYCMFITLLNVTFSDTLTIMYPTLKGYEPLYWLAFSLSCLYLVCRHNRLCWRIVEWGSIVCFIIIAFSVIYGFTIFDVQYLSKGWDRVEDASNAPHLEKYEQVSEPVNYMFLQGVSGPFIALTSTTWWFLGLEAGSLFSKECKDPKHVAKAMYWTWFALALCMIFCSIFGVLVPPGTGILGTSIFPMAEVLEYNLAPQANGAFIWIVIPSLFVNMIASLMSASRQTHALSRSGYLPAAISITDNSDRIPARSACFAMAYSFATCFLVQYLHVIHGDIPTLQALVSLVVIAGAVAYFGVGLTFVVFRVRYANAPRPQRAYLGYASAVCVIVISVAIIIVELGVNIIFQLTVLTYAIKMSISGIYFSFHGRFHLKPTEESLITSFWAPV
jgi:ethanolamine permease